MAVARVFFDVPMNLGLPGLTRLATQKRVRITEDKYLMFMNRKRTKVKIICGEHTLLIYSKDQPISLTELQQLPVKFKGDWMDAKMSNVIDKWLNSPVTEYGDMVKAS